ncbi:MAG: hypothetical protein ACOX2G_04000 [Bacillota bacterium]|jgi:hypothetical protein
MLLALVLTMAVLPAAGTLAYIARTDLAAALDDYHRTKAVCAAKAAVALVEADLQSGGSGQITWPDSDTTLDIFIQDLPESWEITIIAHCGRAVANLAEEAQKSEEGEEEQGEN